MFRSKLPPWGSTCRTTPVMQIGAPSPISATEECVNCDTSTTVTAPEPRTRITLSGEINAAVSSSVRVRRQSCRPTWSAIVRGDPLTKMLVYHDAIAEAQTRVRVTIPAVGVEPVSHRRSCVRQNRGSSRGSTDHDPTGIQPTYRWATPVPPRMVDNRS